MRSILVLQRHRAVAKFQRQIMGSVAFQGSGVHIPVTTRCCEKIQKFIWRNRNFRNYNCCRKKMVRTILSKYRCFFFRQLVGKPGQHGRNSRNLYVYKFLVRAPGFKVTHVKHSAFACAKISATLFVNVRSWLCLGVRIALKRIK